MFIWNTRDTWQAHSIVRLVSYVVFLQLNDALSGDCIALVTELYLMELFMQNNNYSRG